MEKATRASNAAVSLRRNPSCSARTGVLRAEEAAARIPGLATIAVAFAAWKFVIWAPLDQIARALPPAPFQPHQCGWTAGDKAEAVPKPFPGKNLLCPNGFLDLRPSPATPETCADIEHSGGREQKGRLLEEPAVGWVCEGVLTSGATCAGLRELPGYAFLRFTDR